jgi:phospholipase C
MTRKFLTVFMVLAILLMSCGLPSQLSSAVAPTNTSVSQTAATPAPLATATTTASAPAGSDPLSQARLRIKHIVVIMQENRSFDTYFGTFPGANGFPVQNGQFTVCVNDPKTGTCVYPYHDPANKNSAGRMDKRTPAPISTAAR